MDKPKNKNFASTASRISGVIFLTIGGVLLLLVLIALHIISYLTISKFNNWSTEYNLLLIIFVDLFLAGLSLKLGGNLAKGPYLPQTLEGLGKTTKAVLGKK